MRSQGRMLCAETRQRKAQTRQHLIYAVGDKVSYEGKAWTLKAVRGDGGRPITAELVDDKGMIRKARYDYLKPVAAQRPVRQINKPQSVSAGAFVMWKDDDGFVIAGVVTGCLRLGAYCASCTKVMTLVCHGCRLWAESGDSEAPEGEG